MTTKPKLDSKAPTGITITLADDMWEHLGKGYPAIVELEVVERTEPADTETDRSVKLRVTSCEIANGDDEANGLRGQMRAMWDARKRRERLASGQPTLDDDVPGSDVLRHGAGLLTTDSQSKTERDEQGRITKVTFTAEDAGRLADLADELREHEDVPS